ncbi:DUF5666 domain-containing protein [Acidithiobacillus ferrooxidans]|uniref:DUF5666 domain-containing protein n=1 Tax=Acidithiobacillus ferrooxidans TaxID=920 RepID=UPI000FBC9B5D|nr:DUF5666 domain-containing protein [Acidithiobacillus ferrooxidans]QLK41410.1 hypothetical protein FE661_03925 [Acidithiobacillus ferrooxidans]QZT53355.1 DUF5666 domain-containing protein [Acidithiobacillus ferrooxidans]RRN86206.1 MAG: hypothetical protein EC577_03180 [Acidithiobacillus ferrooxidans]BDB13464.1 hypothetical protein ANFP_07840 [Acidithiobacillus ferrooxidans]
MPKALRWWVLVLGLVALPGAWALPDPAGGLGGSGATPDGIGGTGIHPGGIGGTGIHSGGIGGPGIQPGGIGGTGITALGVIQRFGSIYVNGQEYALTPQTRYSIDGAAGTAKDLHLGDRVTVQAAADGRAIAQEVRVEHAVIGRVTEVDAAKRQLAILGETIQAGKRTPITMHDSDQSLPFTALKVGDVVSISGLDRGNGHWLATAIRRLYPGDTAPARVPLLLRGQVDALYPDRDTLEVGATKLKVNGALLRAIQVGQSVVVRGEYADGRAQVESVTPTALAAQNVGNRVSLVGYLARGDNGWTTHGISLVEGPHTLYENGDAANMRAGSMVAISGEVKAPGVIAVESITFRVNPMDFDLPALPQMARGARGDWERSENEGERPEVNSPEIERPDVERPEVRPQVERPEILDGD